MAFSRCSGTFVCLWHWILLVLSFLWLNLDLMSLSSLNPPHTPKDHGYPRVQASSLSLHTHSVISILSRTVMCFGMITMKPRLFRLSTCKFQSSQIWRAKPKPSSELTASLFSNYKLRILGLSFIALLFSSVNLPLVKILASVIFDSKPKLLLLTLLGKNILLTEWLVF